MVVGNNKLTATKNAGKSMVISIAMAMDRRLIYFFSLLIARPSSAMIAKTAFIAVGGPALYTN